MNKLGAYVGWMLVLTIGALALISTVFRLALLTFDDVHPLLSRWAAETFEVQTEIGQASSEWRGVYPSIILDDVAVKFEGTETVHRFDQVAFSLDFIKSLFTLSLVPERISVVGGAIRLQRRENGQWSVEGMPLGQSEPNPVLPVGRIRFREIGMTLRDQGTGSQLNLGEVDLDVLSSLWGIEVLARNRAENSEELGFELQAEFDSMNSGSGILRVERVRWTQLLPWLSDNARSLMKWLPADARMQAEAQLVWETDMPRLAGAWIELEQPHPGEAEWQRLAATLKWQTLEEGYAVVLEQLEWDQRTVVDGAYVEHGKNRTRGYLSSLDIELAGRAAEAAGYRVEDLFPGEVASGTLSDVSGEIHWEEPLRYRIHADMEGIEISLPEENLLLAGVSGTVSATDQAIRFSLDSEDLAVSYAPWRLDAFQPGVAKFQFDWWRTEDCCTFKLTDLKVASPALLLHGDLSANVGESRGLRVNLGIDHVDLAAVSKWLPSGLLLEEDERWIRSAFKAGRLGEARLRLSGPLSSEILAAPDSELTLEGTLHGVDLDYQPGLPMFRGINGKIFLNKESLHVIAREAKIKESTLSHGAVWLADLGLMELHSSGVVDGPVGDVPDFLQEAGWVAPAFNQALKFSGDSTLDLWLNMPLDQRLDRETMIRGILGLHGNRLEVLPNETHLDAIRGEMRYEGNSLTGSLDAEFMERPSRIELATVSSGDLQIKIQASASLADYLPRAARPAFAWLRGRSAWNLSLLLPGVSQKSQRDHLTVHADSDLQGVEIDLPEPLGKVAESVQLLEVEADIEFDGEVDFALKYADQARARIKVLPGGAVQGAVHLGTEMPSLPAESKLRVTGSLPEADLGDWMDWEKQYAGQAGLWPEIDALKLSLLKAFDFEIDDVDVSARFTEENDRFTLDAPAIRGVVNLPKEKGAQVQGVFDRFHLPSERLEAASGEEETDFNPGDLPPMDLKFKRLHLGSYELQDVVLITSPGDRRATIDRLQAKSHKSNTDLNGHWELKDGKHSTLVRGTAHTDDLHETLNHWSVSNSLRKGEFDVDAALQWSGAPHDYGFEKLQGHVDIKGKEGRIRNVAPEAARVLALLNLEQIFDRLSLDFDDVLRGGFTYKTAEGKFNFMGGSLYTSEFRIIGPSAQFLIVGRIGVENEDYDLKVVATPETSALLPAVGAVGGPIGIAGAYVGSKVLEWLGLGIDQATAVTYRVTGSWSDPNIEEITPKVEAD